MRACVRACASVCPSPHCASESVSECAVRVCVRRGSPGADVRRFERSRVPGSGGGSPFSPGADVGRCRRWVAGNSAGGPKAAATFKYNPRYLFRPSAATTSVWVGIEQVLPGTPRYSPVLPGASRLGARDDGPTEGCIHTSARAHAVEERTQ